MISEDPSMASVSSSLSAMSNSTTYNGYAGALSSLAGMVGTIWTSFLQEEVQDVMAKSQMNSFEAQLEHAGIDRDMKVDTLQTELDKQKVVTDGARLLAKATEKRKKFADEVIIQKAITKDHKVTKKFIKSKTNPTAMRRLFREPRTSPFYGNPLGL